MSNRSTPPNCTSSYTINLVKHNYVNLSPIYQRDELTCCYKRLFFAPLLHQKDKVLQMAKVNRSVNIPKPVNKILEQ